MSREPLTVDADPFWVLLGCSVLGVFGGGALSLGIWVALQTWWPG